MMMLIFERISSASGQAAKDQERSQSASSAPALFLIVFEILFPKNGLVARTIFSVWGFGHKGRLGHHLGSSLDVPFVHDGSWLVIF